MTGGLDHQQIRRDAADVARRLAEPATGGNTRPLRTEGAEIILALLDELEQWRIAAAQAQQDVAVLRAELEQAEAKLKPFIPDQILVTEWPGGSEGDVEEIKRVAELEAELEQAEKDARRWEEMYDAEHQRLREVEARLEQAENGARGNAQANIRLARQRDAAEARLAKVPPLEEIANAAREYVNVLPIIDIRDSLPEGRALQRLLDTLAAWDNQ
jgi:hypothetical protein